MKYLGPPQSGSRADLVASRNQYGQYYRERVSPIEPSTPRSDAARARMALTVAAWESLTDLQREAWRAAELDRRGPLGERQVLTGFGYFTSVNLTVNGVAGSVMLPPAQPGPLSLTGFSAATDLSHSIICSAETPAGAWITATAPLTAGSMSAPGRVRGTSATAWWRRVTFLPAGGWPSDVSSSYVSAWGPLLGGERIWVQARELRAGGLGPPQRAFLVVG